MAIADQISTYAAPGQPGSPVELKGRYENFIGGEWVPPSTDRYRDNVTPSTGEAFCEVADSAPEDVELALDAACRQGGMGKALAGGSRRGSQCGGGRDRCQLRDARRG